MEYGYKPWEILDLDPWWVSNVTFYPREVDGKLVPMQEDEAPVEEMSPQEKFSFGYRRRGFPDWKIAELWEKASGQSGQSKS